MRSDMNMIEEQSVRAVTVDHSEDEKLAAAYALNMCTVSVSQIVDYNDLYILEQEYDAILNNLNLKRMPKDEALLRALTEILNTITFFRIQELQKAQIEKKYQQRLKGAIWSAIPSPGIFLSSNPVFMAISLATTIGTGYMNYRKEKFQTTQEKEDAQLQLQITAIEQLNALRRELFTAAWRLADKYGFEDEYRLTERQIKQYNAILTDGDEHRKYARLEAIKDNFKAYPPFWYFLGHTANYIAATDEDAEVRSVYTAFAKEHFEHYRQLNRFNILREDSLAASCALEYVDLLLQEQEWDRDKIGELLGLAVHNAGNSFDIIQLSIMSYLHIGRLDEAEKWLKILVNEDYNRIINAQLLSGIYAGRGKRAEYSILTKRVPSSYLYPMPAADETDQNELNARFLQTQKTVLKQKYHETLVRIINRNSEKLFRNLAIFDLETDYGDVYFQNSSKGQRMRAAAARVTFADDVNRQRYLSRLQTVNLPLMYVSIFEEIFSSAFQVNCFCDKQLRSKVLSVVDRAIIANRDAINRLQDAIDEGTFSTREFEQIQSIGVRTFVIDGFGLLYQAVCAQIEGAVMDDLPSLEGSLMKLCELTGVREPEISLGNTALEDGSFKTGGALFDAGKFGAMAIVAKNEADYLSAMVGYVKKQMANIPVGPEVSVFYRGDREFEHYFCDSIFSAYPQLKSNSLMVIRDDGKKQFDLIFTTEGIVDVVKKKVGAKTSYRNVQITKNKLELAWKKYSSEAVDVGALATLAKSFDSRFINNTAQMIEYVEKLDLAEQSKWFTHVAGAAYGNVQMYYAFPKAELLTNMGYQLEEEMDKNRYLLQFCCENEHGAIIDLRIIEYEKIDESFYRLLENSKGVLRVTQEKEGSV